MQKTDSQEDWITLPAVSDNSCQGNLQQELMFSEYKASIFSSNNLFANILVALGSTADNVKNRRESFIYAFIWRGTTLIAMVKPWSC
jgi:hypothetical protein